MKRKLPLTVVTAICLAVCVSLANAHSGGLNREGCHNNRKTGDYHCHGGRSTSAGLSANSLSPDNANRSSLPSHRSAFRNCTEARAAGAAPVRAGDPGYGPLWTVMGMA